VTATRESSASASVRDGLARLAMHVNSHPVRTSADTRSRILEAAIILFAGRGYAGTSMRDIARRVGVKAASLYVHFPGGKQQLLRDALVEILDEFLAFILGGLDCSAPSAEQLRAVLYRHVTWQLRFAPKAVAWDTAAEQISAEPAAETDLVREVTERQELYHGYVQALVEELRPGPLSAQRSRAVLVLCDRARVWHASGGGGLSTEEGVADLIWELAKDLVSGPHSWQNAVHRPETTVAVRPRDNSAHAAK
jgi:AcrR family transcriptional regulator